tara:strand:+ start:277 stop:519 length:243 start_codon:yes stop_codon:yes gene_type:complete
MTNDYEWNETGSYDEQTCNFLDEQAIARYKKANPNSPSLYQQRKMALEKAVANTDENNRKYRQALHMAGGVLRTRKPVHG